MALTEWIDDSETFIAHYQRLILDTFVIKAKKLVANCIIKNHGFESIAKFQGQINDIPEGAPTLAGCQPIIEPNFPEMYMEIEKIKAVKNMST